MQLWRLAVRYVRRLKANMNSTFKYATISFSKIHSVLLTIQKFQAWNTRNVVKGRRNIHVEILQNFVLAVLVYV